MKQESVVGIPDVSWSLQIGLAKVGVRVCSDKI